MRKILLSLLILAVFPLSAAAVRLDKTQVPAEAAYTDEENTFTEKQIVPELECSGEIESATIKIDILQPNSGDIVYFDGTGHGSDGKFVPSNWSSYSYLGSSSNPWSKAYISVLDSSVNHIDISKNLLPISGATLGTSSSEWDVYANEIHIDTVVASDNMRIKFNNILSPVSDDNGAVGAYISGFMEYRFGQVCAVNGYFDKIGDSKGITHTEITVEDSLIPDATNAINLGNANYRYQAAYLKALTVEAIGLEAGDGPYIACATNFVSYPAGSDLGSATYYWEMGFIDELSGPIASVTGTIGGHKTAANGGSVASATQYINLAHNLGTKNLIVKQYYLPQNGFYNNYWVNSEGQGTVVFWDDNNIRLYNDASDVSDAGDTITFKLVILKGVE